MNSFLGQIKCFAFPLSLVPSNWVPCNGQILSIQQNTALYSLIGTAYGGNGTSNFALPNLNQNTMQNIPICFPLGTSAAYNIGDMGGNSYPVTLALSQMPAHTHPIQGVGSMTVGGGAINVQASLEVSSLPATLQTPVAGCVLAQSVDFSGNTSPVIYNSETTGATAPLGSLTTVTANMNFTVYTNGAATAYTGAGDGFSVLPPYVVLNFCICISGVFPPQS